MNRLLHVCQQLDKPFRFWKAEVVMMLGQALLWKKYYNKSTHLYCDSNTYQMFKNLDILDAWDAVDLSVLDETIDINKTRFWSAGKIRVMAVQTEPYVLSDLDLICFDDLTNTDFFKKDFAAYHKETWLFNPSYSKPKAKMKEAGFKPSVKTSWFANPFNVAFIAMNNMELNQQFTSNAMEYMLRASKIESPKWKNNQYTIFVEQYLLSAIVKANKYTSTCAIAATYLDHGKWYRTSNGMWSLDENWKHSIHLWLDKYNFSAGSERESWYINMILERLEEIDPTISTYIKNKLSKISEYNQYLRM